MSDALSNFPEPKSESDLILTKAAELLDADNWQAVTDDFLTINGTKIHVGSSADGVYVMTRPSDLESRYDKAPKHYDKGWAALPIRQAFWESFKGAMGRRGESLLSYQRLNIENPNYTKEKAEAAKREDRREMWHTLRLIAVVTVGVLALLGGIVSCIQREDRARAADLNQTNEYGFRKGDFAVRKRWDYPGECSRVDQDDPAYHWARTLPSCKSHLEEWEEEGRVWVDWESAQ
ncbi:MAG: hypothetical protein AAGK02_07225 [Pseudomonadota bacterium]